MITRLLKPFLSTTIIAATAIGLSACGGSSSDDSSYSDSYLQFYNGSANSASTIMAEVDSSALGSAAYGDSTSVFTLESGSMDLEFYRTDADDQEVSIEEREVTLRDGEKLLVVLSGDYASPSFEEFRIKREDLADHFRLFVTSVIPDGQSYDLYMSDAGAPFSAASLLGTVNYQGLTEMTYWDPDTDSDDFDEGEYVVYLTLPGEQTPVFESPTIDFIYATEYTMVLRKTTGAIQGNVEIDLVINSSLVDNYADAEATAQYRVYNSLDNLGSVTISFDGNVEESDTVTLQANTLSEFNATNYGDYRLSASTSEDASVAFNNRLVTLNQGESKAIVIYQDSDNKLTSLSFTESILPQVYDHQVQVANLVSDFFDVDFYFVRKDETIETAEYRVLGLDYAQTGRIILPSDYYELIAVYDDNNDTQVLLDRTTLLGVNEETNYIITIEKDVNSATGYVISLLH